MSENEVKDQPLAQMMLLAPLSLRDPKDIKSSVRKGARTVQEIKINKQTFVVTKTYFSRFTVCSHDPIPQSHLRPGLKPPSTSLISDLPPLNLYTAFPTSRPRLLLLVIFLKLLQQHIVWCIFSLSFLDGFWKRKMLKKCTELKAKRMI